MVLIHENSQIQVSKPIEYGQRILHLAKTQDAQLIILQKDSQVVVIVF